MIWPCYNKVTWRTRNLAASVALSKQVAAWSCHFLSASSLAAALLAGPRALASGHHRFVSSYSKGQTQFPPAKTSPTLEEKKKKTTTKRTKPMPLKVNGQLRVKGQIPVVATPSGCSPVTAAHRHSVGRDRRVNCLPFEETTRNHHIKQLVPEKILMEQKVLLQNMPESVTIWQDFFVTLHITWLFLNKVVKTQMELNSV